MSKAVSPRTASTNQSQKKPIRPTAKDLRGIVTYADEKLALIEVTHTKYGELEVRLSHIGVLRKSIGFMELVEYIDDFLSVSDEVVVDIKQNRNKKWVVTRICHCEYRRPVTYEVVEEYFCRKLPALWPQPPKSHVPRRRTGEIVSIMSHILRCWNMVPVELFLHIVHEFEDDLDGVFESFIRTENALRSFVRTVPQYFFLDDDDRVCMYEGFEKHEFQSAIAEKCSTFPVKGRRYSLSDVQIVQTVHHSYSVLQPMLDRAEDRQSNEQNPLVVALDCEGVNLSRTGRLTLVQVSTMEGQVYLFDVMSCPSLFGDGLLGEFLESDAVLKVIHDCRHDAAALDHQYNVTLTNIFDTSIAYAVLQDQCMMEGDPTRPRISHKDICEMLGETVDHKGKKFHSRMVYTKDFWARRPLQADMIKYAASDVYLLVPNVYRALDRLINPNWRSIFRLKCEDAIQEQIEDDGEDDE